DAVATGFDFPTSLAFAPDGRCFVGEGGLRFGGARAGARVWEVRPHGARRLVADGFPAPLTGLAWHDDGLVVSALGAIHRLEPDGTRRVIVDGLPAGGNYHTNVVAAGADGWLYFGQGAMTNAGVV